jgi:hypothetical protein
MKNPSRRSRYSLYFDVFSAGSNGRSGRPYTSPQLQRLPNSTTPATGGVCSWLNKVTGAIRSESISDRHLVLAIFIARSLLAQKEVARGVVRSVNQ